MEEKENLKNLLDKTESNNGEQILDCTKEIEEYRGFLDLKQISHIFVAKVLNNTHILNLTEKEINEGAKIVWLIPEEALKTLKESYDKLLPSKYDNIFDTQFDVVRDIRILEYYNNIRDLNINC